MNKFKMIYLKAKSNDTVRWGIKFAYSLMKMYLIGTGLGYLVTKIADKFESEKGKLIATITGLGIAIGADVAIGNKETKLMQLDYENYLEEKEEFEDDLDEMDFETNI